MPWEFNDRAPVFMQIADKIRADILRGTYPADTQIPAVRQLALDAAVNPNTVQRALSQLENEGLLYAKGTVGRFVTSDKSVLSEATMTMKRKALEKLAQEARDLGITDAEIITYLRENNEKKEAPLA